MISGMDPEDYLRNFDTTRNAVTFRGDEYNLQPMIDTIIELHGKLQLKPIRLLRIKEVIGTTGFTGSPLKPAPGEPWR